MAAADLASEALSMISISWTSIGLEVQYQYCYHREETGGKNILEISAIKSRQPLESHRGADLKASAVVSITEGSCRRWCDGKPHVFATIGNEGLVKVCYGSVVG